MQTCEKTKKIFKENSKLTKWSMEINRGLPWREGKTMHLVDFEISRFMHNFKNQIN